MNDTISRAERIRGGLWGALVGDALGVPVEFSEREARDADPVTGLRAFGTWRQPAGTWSDDGALLLCTADGLAQGLDYAGVGALFVRWYREGWWTARGDVFDIGNTTAAAIQRLQRGAPALEAGPRDSTSNGNGSLMRILPVAWHFAGAGKSQVAIEAMQFSRLTHGHLRAQLCCAFYCVLAAELLGGASPAAAFASAQADFQPLLAGEDPDEVKLFARLLRGDFATIPRAEIFGSGYVLHTLEAACWCLLHATDYRSAVLAAVNLGGDTDTTGCVVGGLAGLWRGTSDIPPDWLAELPRREEVEALAVRAAVIGDR